MTNGAAGSSKHLSKEILVGRVEKGARLAQVVVRIKDEVGAVANVNTLTASLKVDVRQSVTYSLPGQPFAIYNAFVSLGDPNVSLNQLVDRLRQSVFVMDVQAYEGRDGAVVDTISFPINWQGRRVVILAQQAMSRMLEGVRSVLGSGGDVILYELGADYGKELANYFMGVLGSDYLARNYDYGLNVLTATGWGIPVIIGNRADFPNMTIKLSSCLECDGRYSKQPVCSFMRGFLSGVFGKIAGHTVHCEEPQCIAKGDSRCQFELHSARRPSQAFGQGPGFPRAGRPPET
jgi:predicted hydrocarbon binding protein